MKPHSVTKFIELTITITQKRVLVKNLENSTIIKNPLTKYFLLPNQNGQQL